MRVKQAIVSLLFFLFFLGKGYKSSATHIFGGDLLYKHLSDNSYVVTLTLYGDCSGASFPSLPTSVPEIFVYGNGTYVETLRLTLQSPGVEVSPVCPGMINNTTCASPAGTLPGVKRFIFVDTVELTPAANWRLVFAGGFGTGGGAGRSQNITNIANPGSSLMQIEATLNNLSGPNSSPRYTSIPTPFYCMDIDQQYNQGAIDDNGDSLAFALVDAVNGVASNPLLSSPSAYNSPYSGAQPLATGSGDFTFSGINGQLTFKANVSQNALVVCQVSEYRGGVLVGTSQREMTFIVAPDCEGIPPTLKLVNVTGGSITGKNIVNICVGTPSVTFGISVANPDKDATYINARNLPPGAVVSVVGNSSPTPAVYFSWAGTDTLKPGVYTFFLDVENNHCPISNRQTIAYTINVTPYPTVAVSPLSPTRCVHQAYMEYDMALGYIPRTITIKSGTNTIITYKDTTGVIRDSLPVGNYTIIASCSPLCAVSANFNISDSGSLPLNPVTVTYCQRDPERAVQVPVQSTASIVTWYDLANDVIQGPPVPSTAKPAVFEWYVREQYKVCVSDKELVKAIINPLPVPQILTNPTTICYGDTLYLEASGGVKYTWTPADRVDTTADGKPFTRLITPGLFTVKVENEFGCVDSTSITYRRIEPCCIFYYPTAFTPNNDGNNDRFRVGTPGNMMGYKLAVYNRWGQLVYLTFDPKASWDGTQQEVPCPVGTYYYFFEGMCLTGTIEKHKGDLTLIR